LTLSVTECDSPWQAMDKLISMCIAAWCYNRHDCVLLQLGATSSAMVVLIVC
jgi:hypothetical protein